MGVSGQQSKACTTLAFMLSLSLILVYIWYNFHAETAVQYTSGSSWELAWESNITPKHEIPHNNNQSANHIETGVRMCSQVERLQRMDDACGRHWKHLDYALTKPAPYTLVDPKHRLVMGWMSKGGCTAFKALLMEAAGHGTYHFEHGHSFMFVHNKTLLRTLGLHLIYELNETETNQVLSEYFRFIIVRHPFERLLSVYRGKVASPSTDFPRFAADTLKMFNPNLFRNNKTLSEMKRPQSVLGAPTFSQFITWIMTTKSKNAHWNPIMESIHPCSIKWDAILRLETMEHDGALLLDRLRPDVSYQKISVRHSHQKPPVKDHDRLQMSEFDDVSDDVIAYFLKLYAIDMEMFGYNWEKSNSIASCAVQTTGERCC